MENLYIVNYSRLQQKFILVKFSTRHVVTVSSDFTGIYKSIKNIRIDSDIEISFTDSCIDELAKRNISVEGGLYGFC